MKESERKEHLLNKTTPDLVEMVQSMFSIISQHRIDAGQTLEKFKREAKDLDDPVLKQRASVLADAWELFEADFMILRLELIELIEG